MINKLARNVAIVLMFLFAMAAMGMAIMGPIMCFTPGYFMQGLMVTVAGILGCAVLMTAIEF